MYKPKAGERVKIVDDTCEHGIRVGTIVKISEKRTGGKEAWWVSGRNVFVLAEDVARLNPSLKKLIRTLEKSVVASIKEAIDGRPELKTIVMSVMDEITEEMRG